MAKDAKEGVKPEEKPKVEKFINPQGHIRDRIIMHQTADIPKQGAFISLNGYAFQAKPGEAIDIPRPVRKMIDLCVITEIIQGTDEKGNSEEYTRNRPRYPYTLVAEDIEHPDSPWAGAKQAEVEAQA